MSDTKLPRKKQGKDDIVVDVMARAHYEATHFPEYLKAWPWGTIAVSAYRDAARKQLQKLREAGYELRKISGPVDIPARSTLPTPELRRPRTG